jgi:uncharacterized protein (DUF2252 family)
MVLTVEQYSEIASGYASAAADGFIQPEQREAFAKKAECFRLLAKLAAKQASAQHKAPANDVRREIFEHLTKKRSRASDKCAKPETPAHIQALERLALRWRLFKLETRTFGRYAPLHPRPGRPTPANYRPPVFPHLPRG